MTTDRGNMGKKTEAAVLDWLTARSNADAGFARHRLPDSRAARGAISAQPADMLVAWRGVGAYLVEAKETAEMRRLPKAKIGQYGMLHLFEMAGMHTLVVIYMSSTAQWTYLDASDLFRYEVCPASFPMNRPKYDSADEVLSYLLGPIDRSSW